ncbi:MAG: GGDEF domain-containing protein [Betaproteobacteria bacterium HGW-Betaproteobacteria-7]|jgi:diguanylate cyclase (GGDEF)-like protein/PAS domain S-box-containing protein|nr:MAG: GGDEF domain-containing protein [Betaproteobacteria bacterium HGW-Betaproteobacteria-7]
MNANTPGGERERSRLIRPTVAFAVLIGLLFWLFTRAEEISPEVHYEYLQSLRRVQQADVELNSAVLASHADLLRNYDLLVRHVDQIRAEEASLRRIPGTLPDDTQAQLRPLVERLIASQREKADNVDRFKRSNSILRNSEIYFPQAAEVVLRQPAGQRLLELERLVRRVLALSRGVLVNSEEQLLGELNSLRRQRLQVAGPLSVNQLLVHAELIIGHRQEVNRLVEGIMRSSSASLLEDVTRVYIEGHEASLRMAGYFRLLLYFVTLLLLAYAVYALLRFERDRRKLAAAHHHLAERYEAQRRAEGELRLYATVFTNATEGMTITDADARIVAVNPAFTVISGYQPGDVIGRTPAILNSGQQGPDYYREMWNQLLANGQWQGEIWNRRKDGGIFPEWLSISAVRDEQGAVTHYIGIFNDISERKQSEARIHHMAHHDVLTGLPNRLLLEDRVGQAMLKSKRSSRPMALVFIDLDRFKNINDTLGHDVGDQLLVQAAQRGLSVLRDTDTLSRQGGDEFVVVLPELEHRQDAMHVTRKMLAALCQPYLLAGHELTVSGSAGIALYPDDGQTVSELLRKADAAMYRAKEEGRNTFRFFSSEINTASLGELLLENDLYGALERDELVMYYQPKVDAISGQLVGAEALMRWNHHERGLVPPTVFIPMAEENGMINVFGEWAIRTVCAQQRVWLDAGLLPVPVAVNISAHQFAHDLPQVVARALAEFGLPASLLELELTESLLMRNASRATLVLDSLRRMQVNVAIDDFGTGYSSLSYLKQFPVQVLKIDRSFVCEIDEDGEQVRLASAIIAMAHQLDLAVVAEGVETECQRDYLRRHGCDQFQGFLFGKPQPAAELGRLLAVAGCLPLAGAAA